MTSVCLYKGAVVHRRFGEVSHRLRYRIAYLLLDLDQLEAAHKASHLLSVERPGLISFRIRDHGDGTGLDLAGWVRAYLHANGVVEEAAKVEILTLPRMFGYVFNPISVYFVRDHKGALHHVIYQVNNTFGGRHFYLCPVTEAGPLIDQTSEKALYVSPFFDVEGHYHFKLQPPGDTLALAIRYSHQDGRKALSACLTGQRALVTDWQVLKLIIGFPLMTLGVVAGIHWEALKLWLKGARYRSQSKASSAKHKSKANSSKL